MKKLFIYKVENCEFSDTEPFGEAWKKAKELATALHSYILRYDVKGEEATEMVFAVGGVFLTTSRAKPEDYKIF